MKLKSIVVIIALLVLLTPVINHILLFINLRSNGHLPDFPFFYKKEHSESYSNLIGGQGIAVISIPEKYYQDIMKSCEKRGFIKASLEKARFGYPMIFKHVNKTNLSCFQMFLLENSQGRFISIFNSGKFYSYVIN